MDDNLRRIAPSDLLALRAAGPSAPAPPNPAPIVRSTPTPGEAPLGSWRACPVCADPQQRRATAPNGQGRSLHYWSDCRCDEERAAVGAAARARDARLIAERDAVLLGDPGLGRIARLLLQTFDPGRLAGDERTHPYTIASRWFAAILDRDTAAAGREGPPACLYFHSAGRGRGKTHLAAAFIHQARAAARRVAFIEEASYLSRYWNMRFGPEREQLVALPGERAWLTVIDDLGQLAPGRESTGTQNAWYDVINRRYNRRGWTIITSNHTLAELVQRGTITDAAYSRLYELTRGAVVAFVGDDYRLQ